VTDSRVQMLRDGLDCWNRGDLEGLLEFLEPDVRIHLSGAFPDLPTDLAGHEGLHRFWKAMHDMWAPLEMETGEIESVGDLMLSAINFRGTGRDGIQVERTFYFLWQFDEQSGKVSAYSSHRDRESAVETAAAAREKGGLPA
jgi:ketosteroid isomerase-like protein